MSETLRRNYSQRFLSPYRSINYLLQKSEAFQSVHHVTFILCYTVLYNFFGLRCRFGRHRAEVHRTSCALKQVKSQSEFRKEKLMNLEEQKKFILSGQMYNDLTDELVAARENTVFLTNEYNASFGKKAEVREAILKKLLKSVGKGVHFEPNFRCEFGYNISIGNNFYANFDCIMLDGGGIEIGDNVLFGPRVGIYTSNHATDAWERVHGACYAKPVKIGNNVWIGAGVHINQGVTIGDNTIIGSGSVVTKNIPSNVVAAGVPCKVIREITEADKTEYRP